MTGSVTGKRQRTSVPADELLQQLIRRGAAALIAAALEAELQDFLERHAQLRTAAGTRAVVRNGYLPKRTLRTTLGEIEVRVPRVRDRSHSGVYFSSFLVPPYLKRSQQHDELLPRLYLQGLALGNFEQVLPRLLGQSPSQMSHQTMAYLQQQWREEQQAWRQQSMERKRYLYWHADHLPALPDTDEPGLLVLAGVTEDGYREMVTIADNALEPELKWQQLLEELRARGFKTPPKFVDGDDAPGFWQAFFTVFPEFANAPGYAFDRPEKIVRALPLF
jgi:transposase-like protein